MISMTPSLFQLYRQIFLKICMFLTKYGKVAKSVHSFTKFTKFSENNLITNAIQIAVLKIIKMVNKYITS